MICQDPTTGVFYNSLVGCPTNADPTRSLFDQWEHWLSQPLHLAIWCSFCFVVIVLNHQRRARARVVEPEAVVPYTKPAPSREDSQMLRCKDPGCDAVARHPIGGYAYCPKHRPASASMPQR